MTPELEKVASELVKLELMVEAYEKTLDTARKKIRLLKEQVIPDMVDGLDWDPLTMRITTDGAVAVYQDCAGMVITVRDEFHPRFPKKDDVLRQEIMDYVEQNGGEPLLSYVITLSFSRGEYAKMVKVLAAVENVVPDQTITKEKSINHNLYKTYCRQKVSEGINLPDTLGIFNRRIASVSLAQEGASLSTQ